MGTFITVYLIIINVLGFAFFGIDKYKAIYNRWRIAEKALFGIALIGGSLGSFIGMKVFQHKKSVARFYIGIPVILIIQLLIFVYFYIKIYNRILPF